MKTNLDSIFKTNKVLESSGVWFDISEEIGFLISRFGSSNQKAKALTAKYYKPYAALVQNGGMPEEKSTEISLRVFVESCMIDWKGIQIDGVEVPFSHEAALKLLKEMPDLADTLMTHASNSANYKEDLGNS